MCCRNTNTCTSGFPTNHMNFWKWGCEHCNTKPLCQWLPFQCHEIWWRNKKFDTPHKKRNNNRDTELWQGQRRSNKNQWNLRTTKIRRQDWGTSWGKWSQPHNERNPSHRVVDDFKLDRLMKAKQGGETVNQGIQAAVWHWLTTRGSNSGCLGKSGRMQGVVL